MIFELRNNVDGEFILSQEVLQTKFLSIWGRDNESGGPTMSDKARLFGIITGENYRDELKILIGRSTGAQDGIGTRVEVDDPSLNSRNIWNRIKTDFHDAKIIVRHPTY